MSTRDALRKLGIDSPETLTTWARRRGLLAACIRYTPPNRARWGEWRVIRPEGVVRYFPCLGVPDKDRVEQNARTWACMEYNVTDWVRIESLGSTLFPIEVARELARNSSERVKFIRTRQHLRS